MALPLSSRFFTFYSFKGGVGRSMALLNCAYVLAGSGRRTLIVDFDLEAPGLTFLVQETFPGPRGKSKRLKPGLVELVTEFVASPETWPLGKPENVEAIWNYITDLPIPSSVRAEGTEGRLCLLAAGLVDAEYEARLGKVFWRGEPLLQLREHLFHHLRRLIERTGSFDYILIDARTGFSDEGYLSARVLADHLVVFCALNDQNVIGTARFLKLAKHWQEEDNKPDQKVILVESPTPEWEEDAKKKRREEVERLFRKLTGSPVRFSLSLPYHPRIALREEAMVADWPGTPLARAYRQLTGKVQSLAADSISDWERRAVGLPESSFAFRKRASLEQEGKGGGKHQ